MQDHEFELNCVPTIARQADIMTKNLPCPKFKKDVKAMGLIHGRQGKMLEKNYYRFSVVRIASIVKRDGRVQGE
jgi:hypothetical protein